jgi:arylsulfatase A-like enzyme
MNWIMAFNLIVFISLFIPGFSIAAAEKPLNILILYADDWRNDTLGCAGNPIVLTPNLDNLAKKGIRFSHNYVTTSICGVSRANLLTGQWMSRHGNQAFAMFKTPWEQTFPGLLRKNGYYTGHVGKWHNGVFPKDKYDFGKSYSGNHWIKNSNGEMIHVTKKNQLDALEFLESKPSDKPFLLTVAFFATHAVDGNPKQYLPQPESMEFYKNITIPIPKTATDEHFRKLPAFIANEKNEGRNRWHWRFDTPEKYQEYMKNYYRLATEVDDTCGKIIADLEKRKLLDSTLVIFTTDNGYFHGEHGLADKWYPYQESIRVPLIILDPRMAKSNAGSINDEITLNVDLAPTILNASKVEIPKTMQGRDLSPLYLEKSITSWRKEFFYEHAIIKNKEFIPASEALVQKNIKYIYWPDYATEELYDLTKDAFEEINVIQNENYKDILEQSRTRFKILKAEAR